MSPQEPPHQHDPTGAIPAHATQHEKHWSYLLRLWRSGGEGSWRASLQSVQTGQRHMFADMESLLAFLVNLSH